MSTSTSTVERKPVSLVLGVELARVLSGVAVLGLLLAVVGFSLHRYNVSGTALNFAGPPFAFLMFVLVVLAVVACFAIQAATRTLTLDDTGARDRLFGFGAAAAVATALLAIKLFNSDLTIAAWFAVGWLVITLVSLVLMSTKAANVWLEGRAPIHNVLRWVRGNMIAFIGLLVMLFLYIPNIVVAAMSFNIEHGKKTTYQWYEFGTSNWTHLCAPSQLCGSVVTSLWIGAVATVIATLIGTLAAFALMRHQFSGRGTTNTVLMLPMATPDIVLGTSLLAFFIALRMGGHLGHVTIIIAHVTFCLSYVVMTVKARLAGMDSTLQQAAMDLYADEKTTFWKVTFPLVFPGILSAALLAFSLSFDDYIITNLNAGTVSTFPIFVWGAALRGLPMQVNVIGTLMFLLAILFVATGEILSRRRNRASL
ncbi:ABC transporter permease [Nocardioides sp. Kera G14]|uniref:ABC transporter permease n=1 Tax=Nocardioides sp. Kera G14 TaxID=2884264 RepID=UPI001D12AD36|nr:ABC transporter permease [Nocardioides sp. Kera G14]UDY22603.1 ABC transporter permease [Nocardioides sp. Kera G14]